MSELRRECWVDLEVSANQCGKHKHTLRDAWVRIDTHSEDCRQYLRLSRCPWTIDFPQPQIWCLDYWTLPILNRTSYHLLWHCICCLATLWYQRKRQVIQTYTQAHRNNDPTKQSKDFNQTWCQCHPLLLPSHQGQQMQEHIIHQRRK